MHCYLYYKSMSTINSYKDLIVWQRSIELNTAIYALTSVFPRNEQWGLTSQMRRASLSIASNIAEGRHRGTRKDFTHFLYIAYASASELETQIIIAKQLEHTRNFNYESAEKLLVEIMKMLNSMIQKLKAES